MPRTWTTWVLHFSCERPARGPAVFVCFCSRQRSDFLAAPKQNRKQVILALSLQDLRSYRLSSIYRGCVHLSGQMCFLLHVTRWFRWSIFCGRWPVREKAAFQKCAAAVPRIKWFGFWSPSLLVWLIHDENYDPMTPAGKLNPVFNPSLKSETQPISLRFVLQIWSGYSQP